MSEELNILDKIIESVLALAFAAWAWVVRNFGREHISSMRDIRDDLKDIKSTVDKNSQRISKLEGRMESDE